MRGTEQPPVIDRFLAPLVRFMAIEAASGIVLLAAAGVALALANSPLAPQYAAIWQTHLRIGLGAWQIDESLLHWINDGLMTIFFFVVGLEIKRELVDGELREPRKAALPFMAAIGGMVAPAMIYLALMRGEEVGQNGWGIPMATDIAFVVGFLALLGSRVPPGLKIMLLALAIVDDLGAILVIAVFYSKGISWLALEWAAGGLGVALLCRWLGVRSFGVYLIVGAATWVAMLKSGVHPTVAGVLLGLMTPAKSPLPSPELSGVMALIRDRLHGKDDAHDVHGRAAKVGELTTAALDTLSPLERLETALHPWVAFGIMPLFALANARVPIDVSAASHPIAWSVAAGLVVGKPVGILVFSWLAVAVRIAKLPDGVNWKSILGAGCLGGIGFTMSLFIASLALEGDLLSAGKLGTIAGSVISAVLGLGMLYGFLPAIGAVRSKSSAPLQG